MTRHDSGRGATIQRNRLENMENRATCCYSVWISLHSCHRSSGEYPMLRRLIPQEYDFFESFDRAAAQAVMAARLLLKLTENFGDADPLARELNEVEHTCDDVAHRTIDQLNKSFITPLDREDIHVMILRIDDVVDLINAAANRLAFFGIQKPTQHSVNLAKQVVRGCEKLADAVHGMRSAKNYEQVM